MESWMYGDGGCPSCSTRHVLPRIQITYDAFEDGDVEGWSYLEVMDRLGLSPEESTTVLLKLGCSPDAALDVERTVLGDTPMSEWRRTIDETREQMRKNLGEVTDLLSEFGVSLDFEFE